MSLKNKKIDMGHARALIPVEDPEVQLALFEQILAEGLSVRAVEELVRGIAAAGEAPLKKPVREEASTGKSRRSPMLPEEYKLLKDHLSHFFQTKVQLAYNESGKGKISIPFSSEEELERLMSLFDKLR
jgi:ParB family chromosome partitioning protein